MSLTMWLASGERGLSSEAIALTALGERPSRTPWPLDPEDLRRCLLLLEEAPESREDGLLVLAERCPKWASLVNVWDRLSESLRSEIGETLPYRWWAPETYAAPKTYALMQEALDSVARK